MTTENKQQRLLDVALAEFAQRGYASVGVQEIAVGAGVTKPTLYHYFGNKEGLLASLLERECGSLLDKFEREGEYRGDLIQSLNRLLLLWLEHAQARPENMQLLLALIYAPAGHEVRRLIEPWRQRLHRLCLNLFTAAEGQHGNLRGHGPQLAQTLLGLMLHAAHCQLEGNLATDPDAVYRLVKQFMYGIYAL